MTLLPATAADFGFTHDLTRANMRGYVERVWGPWDPAVYAANYATTDNRVIVAGGERVGFVRLGVAGDRLVLHDVQVVPAWQNRGVGTWALGRVRELACERGLAAMRLRCFPDNPAYRLYLRLGFAVVERGDVADWLEWPTTGERPV